MSDVKITVTRNGSYKVEGPATLVDHEGNPIEPPRTDRFFLCRCGGSGTKPFCDGTHSKIEFEGGRAGAQSGAEGGP